MGETELANKMLTRADKDALPNDHPLRTAAYAFDKATAEFVGTPQRCDVKRFIGATLIWSKYSGEEII